MEHLKFNLNYEVLVKITDKGIKHYVENHNNILPLEYHTSFREFKKQANEQGYHKMQMHQFLDNFGNLGMRLPDYVELNVLFNKNDLTDFDITQSNS